MRINEAAGEGTGLFGIFRVLIDLHLGQRFFGIFNF